MGHREAYSTDITNVGRNKATDAENLSAFPSPLSGVITLDSQTHYIVTQPLDFDEYQLKIPDEGFVQISSVNSPVNTLQTRLTGSTPFIIGDISRLLLTQVSIVSLENEGTLFDLDAGSFGGTLILQESLIQNFASIGNLDNISAFLENVAFSGCDAGITLTDCKTVFFDEVNFTTASTGVSSQGGDHIIINGSLITGNFESIVANPVTGDSVFNIDSAYSGEEIIIVNSHYKTSGGGDWFDPAGLDQTNTLVKTRSNINIIPSKNIKTVTSAYSVESEDDVIIGDTSGGAFTITLPDASNNGNRVIDIKKLEGAADLLTITTTGGQAIDGEPAKVLTGIKGPSLTLQSKITGWQII